MFPFDYITDSVIKGIIRLVRWNINGKIETMLESLNYTASLPIGSTVIDYHILDLLVYTDSYNEMILGLSTNGTSYVGDEPWLAVPFTPYLPDEWLEANPAIRM